MKLKQILQDISVKEVKGSKEIDITGIATDSRIVAPGNLFIPKKGYHVDGNDYIFDAIQAGAKAVVTDIYNPFIQDIVQIIVDDSQSLDSACARTFFQNPSQKIDLIGITGTNGKTTTSYLIKHLLDKGKPRTGLIGTIERIVHNFKFPADLTTPDCIQLHKILYEMVLHKQKHAVMEVSSHALSQRRVDGLLFDSAIYTNLSPEHLDYHKDISTYKKEKEKLLLHLKEGAKVFVNVCDDYCNNLEIDPRYQRVTYAVEKDADYRAENIQCSLQGTEFTLVHKAQKHHIQIPLLGAFNVENALAAISCVHTRGYHFKDIKKYLKTFPGVRGRLERVGNIFVDFAHTQEALDRVLSMLYTLKQGRIITVFGCGGNRDQQKRPLMAKTTEKYSDFVVVTSDNPRQEDPHDILDAIEQGFSSKNYKIIENRRKAIEYAISLMQKEDILLVAGKGHETTQIYKGQTDHFDDVQVVKEILNIVE